MPYIGSGVSRFNTADGLTVSGTAEVTGASTLTGAVTANAGVTVGTATIDSNGDIKLADSDVLYLGSGLDLQIQHNGSGSFITDAGTGDLHLRTDTNLNIQNAAGSENKAVFATDGAVTLYHDNAAKIATTSTGVDVTGVVSGDTLNINGTGSGDIAIINTTANSGTGLYVNSQTANQIDLVGYDGSAANAVNIRSGGSSGAGLNVDTSNNVGIGITPTSPLHVSSAGTGNVANVIATNTSYGNDVLQIRCGRSGATTEYNNLTVFENSSTLKMLIRANGNLLNSNNSYGSLSDQTLKENIVDSTSQWDDIRAIQVRKYNFIDSDEIQIGVVAQELEAAGMSGLVESVEMYSANEEDEPVRNGEFKKSVKYSVLYMKALKALQEAMTRIETLETEMTALKARVTALEDA